MDNSEACTTRAYLNIYLYIERSSIFFLMFISVTVENQTQYFAQKKYKKLDKFQKIISRNGQFQKSYANWSCLCW